MQYMHNMHNMQYMHSGKMRAREHYSYYQLRVGAKNPRKVTVDAAAADDDDDQRTAGKKGN